MEDETKVETRYTADLSDSIEDGSDAWVVDSDSGSFCEMTCPWDEQRAGANLIADALNAYTDVASLRVENKRLKADVARFSTLADERHDLLGGERRMRDEARALCSEAIATIVSREDRIEILRARVAELEAALVPFAEAGIALDGPHTVYFTQQEHQRSVINGISVDDLRAAREAVREVVTLAERNEDEKQSG